MNAVAGRSRSDVFRCIATDVDTPAAMSNQVIILHIWPGMTVSQLKMMLSDPETKGVVMYTYGAGNFPIVQEMLDVLKEAIKQGLVSRDESSRDANIRLTRRTNTDRGQRLSMRSRQGSSPMYVQSLVPSPAP